MNNPPPTVNDIDEAAVSFVKQYPSGVKNKDVVAHVAGIYPAANAGTINTRVSILAATRPAQILKVDRGVLSPILQSPPIASIPAGNLVESDFYIPFAEWLQGEAEEATVAVALGGAPVRVKWANPDVIGTLKPSPTDLYRFPLQLLAAEIKTDPNESVTAFGQAIAYRLFAHRVYIVMPSTIPLGDRYRLESLCVLHDIGLVLFELDAAMPKFQYIVRAQASEPDPFYTNEFLGRLRTNYQSILDRVL